MAVQTADVSDLVDFAPKGFLVTSVYLNVDAREFPSPQSIRVSLDSELHNSEERLAEIERDLSHEARESLRHDLAKMYDWVDSDFDRAGTNGLGIFSCAALDFWQVFHLPDPVSNRVEFGPRPYITPLAAFLSQTKPTAILLTDRQHARIITMAEGDVREWGDFTDWVPRRSDQGGWSQMRYQRRSDHWAKHHVDHAAELMLKLDQHYPYTWLILGVEVDAKHDLLQDLHPYLKDRLIGEISVRIDAPLEEIVEKAHELRRRTEHEYLAHLMNQVKEYAGAGGRGTIGLKDTLQALNEQKVHILLVQENFSQPGRCCVECRMLLMHSGGECPGCGGQVVQLDNVVDAAVQRAIEDGSQVEVAIERDQLEPIDCIGSIMYY
jgi:peptide subunit release factor 1 (eRF1)